MQIIFNKCFFFVFILRNTKIEGNLAIFLALFYFQHEKFSEKIIFNEQSTAILNEKSLNLKIYQNFDILLLEKNSKKKKNLRKI